MIMSPKVAAFKTVGLPEIEPNDLQYYYFGNVMFMSKMSYKIFVLYYYLFTNAFYININININTSLTKLRLADYTRSTN